MKTNDSAQTYRNTIRLIVPLMITCLIFTASCSDDDDTTSPPSKSPSTRFNLYEANLLSQGYTSKAELDGHDTLGNTYTGTYSLETGAVENLDGQRVIPVISTLSLGKTTSDGIPLGTSSPRETTYLIDAETPYRKVAGTQIYTPQSISELPATALIGDSGPLTSWVDASTGYEIIGTWSLTDAGGAYANLIEKAVVSDPSGTVDSIQETISAIDATGDLQYLSITITYPNETPQVVITLSGSAI